MCALFPIAVDSSERKESSICIPQVRSFSLSGKDDSFICCGSEACHSGPPLSPSSTVVERRSRMNIFCIREIERGEGDIAPQNWE